MCEMNYDSVIIICAQQYYELGHISSRKIELYLYFYEKKILTYFDNSVPEMSLAMLKYFYFLL